MSKKLLALLLAMIMIVGSFTSVLAETTAPADDKKAEEKVDEKKDEKAEPAKTEEKTEEKKEEEPVKTEDPALDKAIEVLKKAGFITGYSADSDDFKVEKNVKRSEFASMIVRAMGLEASAKALATIPTGFKDVPTNHWANGYIAVAKQQGFVNGYTDGTFRPDRQISYQDMATMLTIALGQAEVGTVYPAGYIVKAQQLGLFNNVNVPAYTDMATRGNVFKMLYNMITSKEFGQRKIVKAIVLENSRVEKMNDDEIVVEVIKVVQEANWVGANRDKRGDQHKYVLDKDLKLDAEELLGKVVDITVNKDDKIVDVTVDKTYDYKEGQITSVDYKKFGLDKTKYTALFDERYDREDERIYRTYLNNKDYKYEDFSKDYKEGKYDFARVTVKNGKVVFIDAYKFDDIAPVAEVKDGDVWYYDDLRDGRVVKAGKLSNRIITKTSKGYEVAERKAIVKDDVIHFYNDYKNAIVRKDAKLEAKLVKTHLDRFGDEYVVIEGKENNDEYWLNYTRPFRAVYSYEGKQFNVITAREQLKPILGRNVKLLIALDGSVQYIDSDLAWSDGIQAIKQITTYGDVKFLPSKGEAFWAKEGRGTEYLDVFGDSNNLRLHNGFAEEDIVYLSAAEKEEIGLMARIVSAKTYNAGLDWASMNYRYITVGNKNYRYFDNLHAYAITKSGLTQIADMDKFIADNKNNIDLKAYVVSENALRERFEYLEIPYYNFLTNAEGIANIVVFANAKSVTKTNTVYAEVLDKYNTTTSARFRDAQGVYYDVDLIPGGIKHTMYTAGDIVELHITDATKDEAVKKGYVKKVVIKHDQELVSIKDLKYRDAYDINGVEKYFDRDTQIFNRQLGDWVQVYYDEDDGNFVRVIRYFERNTNPVVKNAVNIFKNFGTNPLQFELVDADGKNNVVYTVNARTWFVGSNGKDYGYGETGLTKFAAAYTNGEVKVEYDERTNYNGKTALKVTGLRMPEEIKAEKAEADLAKAKEEIEALGMQKYASTVSDEATEFNKTIASILTKYSVTGTVKVENGMLVTELSKKPDTTKTVKAMNEFKKLTADEEKEEKDKKAAAAENLLKRVARELEGKTVKLGQAYDEAVAKAVITANIDKLAYAKDKGVKVDSVTVKDAKKNEYTVVISHADTTNTESYVAVIVE
jgi:predicted heme/steroid binding protein/predicted XRE-type DNA-binding protein